MNQQNNTVLFPPKSKIIEGTCEPNFSGQYKPTILDKLELEVEHYINTMTKSDMKNYDKKEVLEGIDKRFRKKIEIYSKEPKSLEDINPMGNQFSVEEELRVSAYRVLSFLLKYDKSDYFPEEEIIKKLEREIDKRLNVLDKTDRFFSKIKEKLFGPNKRNKTQETQTKSYKKSKNKNEEKGIKKG